MKNIWDDTENPSWGELAKRAERFVERVTDRDDVVVIVTPDMRTKAVQEMHPLPAGVFYPTQAKIVVNASHIFDKKTTHSVDHVDPNGFFSQRLFPRMIGTLVHESAHAKHSKWTQPSNVSAKVFHWVKLLEETRIERKILDEHPQYVPYIKTILTEIVYGDIKKPDQYTNIHNRYTAAHTALLVCARETINVIPAPEIVKVSASCEHILGVNDYAKLKKLWIEGQNIDDDDDVEALIAVAEKISKLIDPAKEVDDSVFGNRIPCGGFVQTEGNTVPNDGSELPPEMDEQKLDNNFTKEIIEIESTVENKPPQPEIRKETAREKEIKHKKEVKKAKEEIKNSQKTGNGYSPYSYNKPTKTVSEPNAKDVARMRKIMNALKEAQYREVSKTIHASNLPPGRLQIREAMNRDAQIASRQPITAKPWKQTRRREVDNPPLTLAVSTDISGSMGSWQREVSSFTWAVSAAVKNLDGKVGAVAWDTSTYELIDPNKYSKQLTTYNCMGGSSGCAHSIKALDGLMELTYGEGVRVLAVITDGDIGGKDEIQKQINTLTNNGVIVVWLLTQNKGFIPNHVSYAVLQRPEDFGAIMGKVLITALSNA